MKEFNGWYILRHWGFWYWLIVYLPQRRRERRKLRRKKRNEKTLRDIHRR